MASKEETLTTECKDAKLPDNTEKQKCGGHVRTEDKYEEIRKAARSLSPNSRRKIDQALTELQTEAPAKAITVLLTGKTGVGKSTLTNGILGFKECDEDAAKEGDSIKARCTTQVTKYQQCKNGVTVTVWDSPGLQDGTKFQDDYLKQMKQKCKNIDLTMYCIKMIETRFVRGSENPDVAAIEKLTKSLGPEMWKTTIIVLTYANTLEAFNVEWDDYSKKEKAKAFKAKVEEWKSQIREILIEDIKIPKEIVDSIRIVPAGHSRRPNLPGIDYWLTHLWFQCVWTMPTKGAKLAMVKINEKRMKNEDEVSTDDFKKSSGEQPLVVGGTSVVKALTIGGTSGGLAGAGTGAVIGSIGGPPGAALGALIGGLVGMVFGGGAGGIIKKATS